MLFKVKSKKGVSVLIGYVLLVAFIVAASTITYAWLRSYAPSDEILECPEGVSLFMKDIDYSSSTNILNITFSNTGRFDIIGYFIHAKNDSTQELAAIDLSSYYDNSSGGSLLGNSVLFYPQETEALAPGEEATHIFNIPDEIEGSNGVYSVRVTPVRFEAQNNKERFVSCQDARTEQVV